MSDVFGLEQKLTDQLVLLKNKFGLCAIKAELEAEGSSFRDLIRLRRLTTQENIPLYLKIGGVEALRDIKDALDLGVDGLIAPMVESPFGVVKFLSAVESIFDKQKLFKSINIETRGSVENLDQILEVANGKVDNITIGRTDLSQSYFDSAIKPDCPFILDLIENLSCKIKASGLTLTVGGSVNKESIRLFKQWGNRLNEKIFSIETRKVVLPFEKILGHDDALEESLHFEKLYLRHKLEHEAWLLRADQKRLDKLKKQR